MRVLLIPDHVIKLLLLTPLTEKKLQNWIRIANTVCYVFNIEYLHVYVKPRGLGSDDHPVRRGGHHWGGPGAYQRERN